MSTIRRFLGRSVCGSSTNFTSRGITDLGCNSQTRSATLSFHSGKCLSKSARMASRRTGSVPQAMLRAAR